MTIIRALAGGLLGAFLWIGAAAAQVPPTMKLCDGTVAGCPMIGSGNPSPQAPPTPTASAANAFTPVVSGSASSGVVVKASPGNLYGVYATCVTACWLMVFNSIAIPADGATTAGIASGNLQDCIPIAAGGIGSMGANGSPPETFTVGISVAISSTACATKTAATTGFINARAK